MGSYVNETFQSWLVGCSFGLEVSDIFILKNPPNDIDCSGQLWSRTFENHIVYQSMFQQNLNIQWILLLPPYAGFLPLLMQYLKHKEQKALFSALQRLKEGTILGWTSVSIDQYAIESSMDHQYFCLMNSITLNKSIFPV